MGQARRQENLVALGRCLSEIDYDHKLSSVGRAIGVSEATVHRWLHGNSVPTYPHLFDFCVYFKCPVDLATRLLGLAEYALDPDEKDLYLALTRPAPIEDWDERKITGRLSDIQRLKRAGNMGKALFRARQTAKILARMVKDQRRYWLLRYLFDLYDEAAHVHTFVTPAQALEHSVSPLFSRMTLISKEIHDQGSWAKLLARRGDAWHIVAPSLARKQDREQRHEYHKSSYQNFSAAKESRVLDPTTLIYPLLRSDCLEKGAIGPRGSFKPESSDGQGWVA